MLVVRFVTPLRILIFFQVVPPVARRSAAKLVLALRLRRSASNRKPIQRSWCISSAVETYWKRAPTQSCNRDPSIRNGCGRCERSAGRCRSRSWSPTRGHTGSAFTRTLASRKCSYWKINTNITSFKRQEYTWPKTIKIRLSVRLNWIEYCWNELLVSVQWYLWQKVWHRTRHSS